MGRRAARRVRRGRPGAGPAAVAPRARPGAVRGGRHHPRRRDGAARRPARSRTGRSAGRDGWHLGEVLTDAAIEGALSDRDSLARTERRSLGVALLPDDPAALWTTGPSVERVGAWHVRAVWGERPRCPTTSSSRCAGPASPPASGPRRSCTASPTPTPAAGCTAPSRASTTPTCSAPHPHRPVAGRPPPRRAPAPRQPAAACWSSSGQRLADPDLEIPIGDPRRGGPDGVHRQIGLPVDHRRHDQRRRPATDRADRNWPSSPCPPRPAGRPRRPRLAALLAALDSSRAVPHRDARDPRRAARRAGSRRPGAPRRAPTRTTTRPAPRRTWSPTVAASTGSTPTRPRSTCSCWPCPTRPTATWRGLDRLEAGPAQGGPGRAGRHRPGRRGQAAAGRAVAVPARRLAGAVSRRPAAGAVEAAAAHPRRRRRDRPRRRSSRSHPRRALFDLAWATGAPTATTPLRRTAPREGVDEHHGEPAQVATGRPGRSTRPRTRYAERAGVPRRVRRRPPPARLAAHPPRRGHVHRAAATASWTLPKGARADGVPAQAGDRPRSSSASGPWSSAAS